MTGKDSVPSFNEAAFKGNFLGMERLAHEAITSLLSVLPVLTAELEFAIRSKDPSRIEMAAHTLKGAVSNFYAEPSMALAEKLEQNGGSKVMSDVPHLFADLKIELDRLMEDLRSWAEKNPNS